MTERDQFIRDEARVVRAFVDRHVMADFLSRELPVYTRQYTHESCGYQTRQASEIWDHAQTCLVHP